MKRILLLIAICTSLLPPFASESRSQDRTRDPSAKLPLDPKIRTGRLSNGIRYYVRENRKPEKRAELRLAVNAGSVLENDDQRGLAHFCEHMAFNGTRHFRKQELVNYLESMGVRLGPDLNAYTSFDETVYMLQVPTDTQAIVHTAFQILEDWAHLVSYDDDEIDRERGVVVEEWRLGRGAAARMRDRQFPILFKDSRYADRLPIGIKQTLDTCSHETLRNFYRDWYRPDLMAVIAVGDFDGKQIEQLIRDHFSRIPTRRSERPRTMFPVPDEPGTLYAIATDPEATSTNVTVDFKLDVAPDSTVRDYRRSLVENLYNRMLNERLNELTRQSDPPFLGGFSFNGRFVRTKDFYALGATVKDGGIERGLDAILTEAARVRRFGFTATELERQKTDLLRDYEQAFNERDKTESAAYASEYIRNFLNGEPAPGIEYEYALTKDLLPGITLGEENQLAARWITDTNRVVTVSAPQKQGVPVPGEDDLARVIAGASGKTMTAYVDSVAARPLVATPPVPGTIVETRQDKTLGLTEWTLSNGVRVILKPTDFKNDEVVFTAFAPGGSSVVADSDFVSGSLATSVVANAGVGDFDLIRLQKLLAGKIVSVSPFIGELEQGLNGSASPRDLESMFQLIYLYYTAPRIDSVAYQSFLTRMKAFLRNRGARPETAFEDTVQVTMAQHHFRARPFTEALLAELNLQKSFRIYRERFADAGDATFIIVGNFTPDSIRPMVLTYLAGLPALKHHEKWKDIRMLPPSGLVTRSVHKGIEPKSQVRIIFSGPFTWSPANRHALEAMSGVMRIKLRETLREAKGGTYGVGTSGAERQFPTSRYRITISFGCAPGRVDELTGAVFQQIDSLKRFGPDASYIGKVKEIDRRERETQLKQNGFWLNSLQFCISNNENPDEILRYDELVEGTSKQDVQKAAQLYFDLANYVKVVQYPAPADSAE